jgi:hypothetical protein
MPELVANLLKILPPLKDRKDPGMASLVGFLTGGAMVTGYYGYVRAADSNARLAAARSPVAP